MQRAGKEEERSQVRLPRATENAERGYRCTFILQKIRPVLGLNYFCTSPFSEELQCNIFAQDRTISERQFFVTARTNIIFISDIPLCFTVLQTGMLLSLAEVYMHITEYVATVSTHIGFIFLPLFSTK